MCVCLFRRITAYERERDKRERVAIRVGARTGAGGCIKTGHQLESIGAAAALSMSQ